MPRSTEQERPLCPKSPAARRRRLPSHSSHTRPLPIHEANESRAKTDTRRQERKREEKAVERNDTENGREKKRRRTEDPNLEEDGQDVPEEQREQHRRVLDVTLSEQNGDSSTDPPNVPTTTPHPRMSPQERAWYAMSFEALYQQAKSKNFGKTGKEGRKSGRMQIIKWLCNEAGITPYVAPSVISNESTPVITGPTVRPTGAISHPEAILRTSDPALQRSIDKAEKAYLEWPAADLLALCMERSYQLLKDDQGKLPSKSKSAMAKWLAAWDVLKSPREKKWWLGDGIDLVNKAKAMGYQGPSRKYEAIVWLRTTPEDAEIEVSQVAEPTPNKNPVKPGLEKATPSVSKRPAKGSKMGAKRHPEAPKAYRVAKPQPVSRG